MDNKGVLFLSDIFILLIVSILVIGTITTIMDLSHEKILGSVESNLERKTVGVIDNLIKNHGSPDNWDYQNDVNTIPGLGGENNTISFNKLLSLKKSYNRLMDENTFQNEIKSSIAIYPINSKISPIEFGDNENFNTISNVVSVKRLVKCDFLTRFKILDFKDDKKDVCINPNHNKDGWICKPFSVGKIDLELNDYYLLFNDKMDNNYWSINNPSNMDEDEHLINTNSYRVTPILEKQIGNSNQMNFWIHLKLNANEINNFDGCIVAIPKDFNIDQVLVDGLKFEYFQYNDCYLILKTWHEV
ncbi:MAG: hypothetical protein LBT66_05630 [Methanobrevibacter sp.]|jgi:hypothetical protein|nr:hypothetical protein [Candidatus Methanovirga meridionalis]